MDWLKNGAVFAFALSTVSGVAWAAGTETGARDADVRDDLRVSFEEADVDGSGIIDANEAKALDLDVARFDINYDGMIEKDEWERGPSEAAEAAAAGQPAAGTDVEERAQMRSAADEAGVSFEEADLDGSGFIDAPEAQELGLDIVNFDANYNGIIDRVEWARAPEQATERDSAGATQRDARGDRAERAARTSTAEASFEEADLDGSGFVDGPEAKELGLDVLDFDSNYDGIIDRDEWARAPEQATERDRGNR